MLALSLSAYSAWMHLHKVPEQTLCVRSALPVARGFAIDFVAY